MHKYHNIKFYVENHYGSNISGSAESSSGRNHISQFCMKKELR
jgi:hypothetical protein